MTAKKACGPRLRWEVAGALVASLAAACAAGHPPGSPGADKSARPGRLVEVAEPLPAKGTTLTAIHVLAAKAGDEATDEATQSAATNGAETATQAVGMRETIVRLQADQPLVWTTFRDLEGHLIVELPDTRNTVAATTEVADAGLLVERIVATTGRDSFRATPTTRLEILLRRPAIHLLRPLDTGLELRFQAAVAPPARPATAGTETAGLATVGMAGVAERETRAGEPGAAEMTPSEADTPIPADAMPPVPVSDAPLASERLPATGRTVFELRVRHRNGALEVILRADGPLAWHAFQLAAPPRFVVDLPGVIDRAGAREMTVDHPRVMRARLAQFASRPEPVARLVLDLEEANVPVAVERTPTGLLLRVNDPR